MPISRRETQVLELVAEGMSNREIGERLFITERTVKNHLTGIMTKLNANDRAHAVVIAIRRGILTISVVITIVAALRRLYSLRP